MARYRSYRRKKTRRKHRRNYLLYAGIIGGLIIVYLVFLRPSKKAPEQPNNESENDGQPSYIYDPAPNLSAETEYRPELPATPTEPVEEEHEETVEVKGGTTMGELLEYGLTREQFKEITGVEMPDNAALGLRDFVTENGLDMETVKTRILEVLVPTPTEEAAPAESPQIEEMPSPSSEEKAEASIEIKGSTTIGGLLDAGMTKEQFKEITGVDMPDDTAMKLKDFADANGLDMETLKEQIIEALQQ